MGDWEDFCDYFGMTYDTEYYGQEDKPDEVWSYRDNTSYKDVLEMAHAGEGYFDLVIDNHIFSNYAEAANAARVLAIKTQSAVKVFINKNEEIYSICDQEMESAIDLVKNCEIDNGYYRKSPLIKLREQDIIYHENRGNWLFMAHPNGTTENLERNVLGCIRNNVVGSWYNPFAQFEVNSSWTRNNRCDELMKSLVSRSIHKRSEVLNRSLTVRTICERDNLLTMASIIAKSHKIKVYVVRLPEKIDKCGIYQSPKYVMFTEKVLNIFLNEHLEWEKKYEMEKEQELRTRHELELYQKSPEIIELKRKSKTKLDEAILKVIEDNPMSKFIAQNKIYYGNDDKLFYIASYDYMDRVDGPGIFALIHEIMCEEGVYKMILSDKQYDGMELVVAENPMSIYNHADIAENIKLRSTLDEIYNEAIAYFAKELKKIGIFINR